MVCKELVRDQLLYDKDQSGDGTWKLTDLGVNRARGLTRSQSLRMRSEPIRNITKDLSFEFW